MSFKVTARIVKDLDPSKLKEFRKRAASMKQEQVKVGLPAGKPHKSKDSKPQAAGVAYIGAVHEFGDPSHNIPERPWLRPGVRSGQPSYLRLNRINIIKILRGEMDVLSALSQLGAMAAGFVQKYIRNGKFASLKPATIARKGSSKPLIDSGQMVQSVTFEVAAKEK